MNMSRYLSLIIALTMLATPLMSASPLMTMRCKYGMIDVTINMAFKDDGELVFADYATTVFNYKNGEKKSYRSVVTQVVPIENEIYSFIFDKHAPKNKFNLSIFDTVVDDSGDVDVWESIYYPPSNIEQTSVGSCYIDGM